MAAPVKTLIDTPNNAFSSTAVDTQYGEALFALKNEYVQGGWTVVGSSDGTTASMDGTDRWPNGAGINQGTAGNGSWIVLRSPTGDEGEVVEMIIATDDNTSPLQQFDLRITGGTYSGGSASSLPTSDKDEDVISAANDDIIPWSVATTASWHAVRSDDGRFLFFGIKEDTVDGFRFALLSALNTDSEGGGDGAYRFALFTSSGAGNRLTAANLTNSTNWLSLEPGGDDGVASAESTVWEGAASWSNDGVSSEGSVPRADVELWANSGAAQTARYIGKLLDCRGVPAALPWNDDFSGEPEGGETQRMYAFGGIALFFTDGTTLA